ncbi:MAG: hypothetical protein LBV66_02165, partial [Elusimicrobiota bacterium]|nr:hypothetical protein [Elusimicrobiota bacterium]
MFYNKKWVFFIVLYAMSFVLYFFINEQAALIGVNKNALEGSLIVYGGTLIICALISLIISLIWIQ